MLEHSRAVYGLNTCTGLWHTAKLFLHLEKLSLLAPCYISSTCDNPASNRCHAWLQIVFQTNPEQAQPRAQMFSRDAEGKEVPVEQVEVAKKPYQFLWVSILREYLAFEFKPEGHLPFLWDQERVYDDFGEL